jgi:hypothetical protein
VERRHFDASRVAAILMPSSVLRDVTAGKGGVERGEGFDPVSIS